MRRHEDPRVSERVVATVRRIVKFGNFDHFEIMFLVILRRLFCFSPALLEILLQLLGVSQT
jgi:hypothetical protein